MDNHSLPLMMCTVEVMMLPATTFPLSLLQKIIFLGSNVASGWSYRTNTDCLRGIKRNEIKKESGAMDSKRKHCINQLAVVLDQRVTDHNETWN